MNRPVFNRAATTYLEVQVAMVMLAIATAGLYSVSAIQTKQSARLTNRVFAEFADADAAINPATSQWARKLGVIATLDEAVAPPLAIPADNYFVSITDNESSADTTTHRDSSDYFNWYRWTYFGCYQGTSYYHRESTNTGNGSYCEQRIDGIPSGAYEVLITHPALNSFGRFIPYEIYDGSTLIETVQVNQRIPCTDTILDSHGWKRVTVTPITSGSLRIRMLDGPGSRNYVIADAIAVRTRKFELTLVTPTGDSGATAVLESQ